MANRGESSIKIHDFQWDKFWPTIEKYSDLSEKERNFVLRYLQPNDSNELWLRTFRDCLSKSLGFSESGSHATFGLNISDRENALKLALPVTLGRFDSIKDQIRKKSEDTLNTDEEKLLSVNLEETDDSVLTMRMIVDIARILGFHRMPNTQSWGFAGESFQMAQFCQDLFNLIHGTHDAVLNPYAADDSGYANNDDLAEEENQISGEVFKPNSTISTYIRLCVQKTWAESFIGANLIPYTCC